VIGSSRIFVKDVGALKDRLIRSILLVIVGGDPMKMSHVHCRVRDLQGAARWFEQVWQVTPVFHNERMVWLSFRELGVILDAGPADSTVIPFAVG
jgi:hypothetical protein